MRPKFFLIIICLLPILASAQTNIGEQTIRFNDTLRKRPLITEIWYPTTDHKMPSLKESFPFIVDPVIINAALPMQRYPLIMLSHGTGGGRLTLEWLADILVKHGFIVAAVDHWGNTYDNKIAIDFVTPWRRAQDISFVLTQLLKNAEFSKIIDRQRIGAAGFSMGGYTVIALAGGKLSLNAINSFAKTRGGMKEMSIPEFPNLVNVMDKAAVKRSFINSPPLKDRRIKAVFAICPAIGQGFIKNKQLKDVNIPVFIIGAQSDSVAPVKTNAAHYHKLLPASKLFIVPGKTGHYVFLNEAIPQVKETGGVFFNDDPTVNRHAVHELVGNYTLRFFKEYLR